MKSDSLLPEEESYGEQKWHRRLPTLRLPKMFRKVFLTIIKF